MDFTGFYNAVDAADPFWLAAMTPALLWAKLTTPVDPGPLYFTDDPEPVDFHHYEAYISSQYLHTHTTVSGTAPHF